MTVKLMIDQTLAGKRVLIREDLNVPDQRWQSSSDARIKAALPTIKQPLDAGAKLSLCPTWDAPPKGSTILSSAEASSSASRRIARPARLQ